MGTALETWKARHPTPRQRAAESPLDQWKKRHITSGRGGGNPSDSANSASATDDARGEQLKLADTTAQHTASTLGMTVTRLSERLLADPTLINNAPFTQTLTAAKVKADEANAAAEQASAAVSAWEKDRWDREMAEKYGGIRQSSDYTMKNRAVMDYAGDSLYDYINSSADAKGSQTQRAMLNDNAGYVKYDGMTKEEIADFNYLYATQGRKAAAKYLDEYLGAELNKRQAIKTTTAVRDFTEKGKAAASAVSVPVNLMSGIGIVELTYQQLKKGITGSNRPIDWDTPIQQAARIGSEIRDKRSEDIAAKHPWEVAGMNVASFLYGTGMSMADSAVTAILSKVGVPAAGALLGGAAATQAAHEARARGASDGQAIGYGLAAGAAEMVFETISIGTLLGKLDVTKKILTSSRPKVEKIILNALVQGGVEASEEVMTTLANTMSDAIINGDKSEFQADVRKGIDSGLSGEEARKQAAVHWLTGLAGDALGGFLSGGIMGGSAGGFTLRALERQQKAADGAQRGEERKPALIITAGIEKAGNAAAENAEGTKPPQKAVTAKHSAVNYQETVYSGREAGVDAERIQQAARLSALVNRKVVFYKEAATGGGIQNGYYQDGVIHLNAASQNPVAQVISHELTHSVEATEAYGQLAKLVEKRVTGMGLSMDTLRERKTDLYAGNGVTLSKEDADAEIIAEYVEKNLLTNEQSIAELVKQDRTLGQRLHDWIDSLLSKLGDGSAKERAFLTEAKRLYAKALNQSNESKSQTGRATSTWESTITRDYPYLNQLREKLDSGDISETEYDRLFDEYYDANLEADGGKHSILPTMQRTGQDTEQVVAAIRSYLRGGMTKAELLRSIDAVEADGKPADDGVKAITEAAKANKQSVEQYLRENWMDYERDGRWKPEAQRALDAERSGKRVASGAKYSLEPYSEKQKKNWKDSKRIVLYESDDQLRSFVEESKAGKNAGKKMYFGMVPENLAELILEDTGLDLTAYNCAIQAYEIQKVFNDHGNDEREALRGQRGITVDDFVYIPKVIQNPDKIELSPRLYNGKPVITFTRDIDGKRVVTAYVSDKHIDLLVQTMYAGAKKGNLPTPIGEQAPINTPEANGSTVSKDNIQEKEARVKSQAEQKETTASEAEKTQKRFSVSEAQDKTYLAAVESGDMETAQRMVDEAAKAAGYDVKAYHASDNKVFTVFQSDNSAGLLYFSESSRETRAAARGKRNVDQYYLCVTNPVNSEDAPLNWYDAEDSSRTAEWRRRGYNCVYVNDESGVSIAVFSPAQIKSAEPVTYDDAGNVIPLSERFNPEERDIRHSRELAIAAPLDGESAGKKPSGPESQVSSNPFAFSGEGARRQIHAYSDEDALMSALGLDEPGAPPVKTQNNRLHQLNEAFYDALLRAYRDT